MDGTIGVETDVGVGSTFWIDLAPADHEPRPEVPPARVTAPGADEAAVVLAAPAAGLSPVVLYIEDNLVNVRLMEHVLRERPERLEVALQGQVGIDLARELRPRLVLLDLDLPDIGGDEVLRVLKSDPATADIAVAIISADVTPGRVQALRDLGAVAYMSKPIRIADLVGLLDATMAGATSEGRQGGVTSTTAST
jgi:CheY-like chemotaxis protein